MIKTSFDFLSKSFIKYPGETLMVVIVLLNIWGYYNLNAADNMKADKKEVDDIKIILVEMRAEQKAQARHETGRDSWIDIQKLPPSEFLIGAETTALRQKYDSCLEGKIPDSLSGIKPWICWYNRVGMADTFRIFRGQ